MTENVIKDEPAANTLPMPQLSLRQAEAPSSMPRAVGSTSPPFATPTPTPRTNTERSNRTDEGAPSVASEALRASAASAPKSAPQGGSSNRKITPTEYIPMDGVRGEKYRSKPTDGFQLETVEPTIFIDGVSPGMLPGTEECGHDESDNGPRIRVYQSWPGKNKFLCRGRCITGGENGLCIPSPSLPSIGTWLCILVPTSVYFVFVGPRMWDTITPALPIATGLCFLLTIITLLSTCLTDPGILPRRDVVLACEARERLADSLGYDALGLTGNGVLESMEPKDVENLIPQDLVEKGYRWCRTCKIIKPPRSAHCNSCDNCVMRFDHHCPFVNNCVGQRNYLCFFGFTSAVTCLSLLVIPSIFWHVIVPNNSALGGNWDSTTMTVVQWLFIILLGFIIIAVIMVMGLWVYHTFLIIQGKTTKEHLKGRQASSVDKQPTIFASRGPRMFDPRALVIAGILKPKTEADATQDGIANFEKV